MVFAHALIAMQAYATVPGTLQQDAHQAVQGSEPCHEESVVAEPSPKPLLCKHHCLSELLVLDHADADLAAPGPAALLTVATTLWKPLVGATLLPSIVPHAGAPPPFLLTARLRI